MHDQRPELGIDPSRADRASIPSGPFCVDRLRERFHPGIVVGAGVFGDALLNPRFPVRGHLELHLFNNERKAGLGIDFNRWRACLAAPAASACSAAAERAVTGKTAETEVVMVAR